MTTANRAIRSAVVLARLVLATAAVISDRALSDGAADQLMEIQQEAAQLRLAAIWRVPLDLHGDGRPLH